MRNASKEVASSPLPAIENSTRHRAIPVDEHVERPEQQPVLTARCWNSRYASRKAGVVTSSALTTTTRRHLRSRERLLHALIGVDERQVVGEIGEARQVRVQLQRRQGGADQHSGTEQRRHGRPPEDGPQDRAPEPRPARRAPQPAGHRKPAPLDPIAEPAQARLGSRLTMVGGARPGAVDAEQR
jgi:hypothetical protein